MTLKRDPSLLLQLGFLALLLISTVQVGWWMYDHVSKARDVESRFAAEYQHDADALTSLFSGAPPQRVAEHLPAIAVVTSPYFLSNLYGRGDVPEFVALVVRSIMRCGEFSKVVSLAAVPMSWAGSPVIRLIAAVPQR